MRSPPNPWRVPVRARLVGGFAALALLLAAVGVFGVLAFGVSQRKREFGIRMAMGAQISDVLSLVLTRGAKIAAAGIAAGMIGAVALASSLAALLFGGSLRRNYFRCSSDTAVVGRACGGVDPGMAGLTSRPRDRVARRVMRHKAEPSSKIDLRAEAPP